MPKADVVPRKMPTPAVQFGIACVVFLLATLLVFGDVLAGGSREIISSARGDVCRQFLGWYDFGFTQLSHGHLPLWNPYVFSGAPFFAGFQSALLYPPNWLYMILPLGTAINISIVLHVFLAGVFMYLWSAYRGLHPAAAIFSGLVFMFGGAFFAQISGGHLPNMCVMTLTPLIFLAIDDLTQTRSLRGAALGAGIVGLQIFAGHPQYVFYTAVIAAIYAALNVVGAPSRKTAISGFALCYVGGGLLAAVQLFAGLAATGEAMRSKLSYELASTFPFPPENLLTMIMPGFFGNMTDTPYWGRWFIWEDSIFIGVTAMALAIIGAVTRPSLRRFAVTMMTVAFVIALGKHTPLFHLLYRLPGFSSFRVISKFIYLVLLFIALLAGLGFDWLLKTPQLPRFPVWIAGASSAALASAALVITPNSPDGSSRAWTAIMNFVNWNDPGHAYITIDRSAEFFHQTAVLAGAELRWAAIMSLAFAGMYYAARSDRKWAFGLLALGIIDLVLYARGYHFSFSQDAADQRASDMAQVLARCGTESRFWSNDQADMLRLGGSDAWGEDPMILRRYCQFVAEATGLTPDVLLISNVPPRASPLWDLIRLRYFCVYRDGALQVLSSETKQLGRAQLMGRCEIIPSADQRLRRLSDPGFDRLHTAIVEATVDPMPSGAADSGTVKITDISTDELDVEADVRSPAILVISDAYSDGWHAEPVDSGSQPRYEVIPVDHALRGVALGLGRHHLHLIYRPLAFVVGAWVSGAAWLAYAGIGAARLTRLVKPPFPAVTP